MPLFTDEKLELLRKAKITQLRRMAKEKSIEVKPILGIFRSKPNIDDYIRCLYDSRKVSKAYIKRVLGGKEPSKAGKVGRIRAGKKMAAKTVAEAVKRFRLKKRYDNESEFERDFLNWCEGRFGSECVIPQYSVGRTRIDAVVGGVGIELKLPKSARALTTLRGQVEVYREHFGKKLIVVLVGERVNPVIVSDFKRDMKKKGVEVIHKR